MSISIKEIIQKIIIIAIICTPIFTISEVYILLISVSETYTQSKAFTPVYIKLLKDIFFVAIIILTIISGKMSRYWVITIIFSALFIMLPILYTVMSTGITMVILAGIRWVIPIFLPFFLIDVIDKKLLKKVSHILIILFTAQLFLQIFELFLFFMSPVHKETIFGFAARPPGMFLIPNTAALFSVLCVFFYTFYHGDTTKYSLTLVHLAGAVSIFLTKSGTGIVAYGILLLFTVINRRYYKITMAVTPIMVLAVLPILYLIAGRSEDYLESSLGVRIGFFLNLISNTGLISDKFGAATNAGWLLATEQSGLNLLVADGGFNSIAGNLGLIGFVICIILIVAWLIFSFYVNSAEIYSFSMIFLLFAVTTIISEAYPMNLLFAICLAYYLSTGRILKHITNSEEIS